MNNFVKRTLSGAVYIGLVIGALLAGLKYFASWTKALAARDESGGRIDAVTDRAILAAYRLLARSEAVFVEPASAASVAGLLQVAAAGELEPGQRSVCTVTGNGLKDPEWAISGAPAPLTIPVDAAAAAAQLGL